MNTWTTRAVTAATASAAALALAGCGGTGGTAAAGSGGDGLTVVAGFYPLEWAAQRVGGDRVDVSSLTPPGAEAHDLELAPQDVAAVSEADLLVYLEGFQPALDEAAQNEAADTAWDAGQAADLSLTAEEHGHEGETAEEHAEHAEEGEEGEALDPHFWLDPTRLASVGDALAERLAEADPDGAATYEENAAALRADLEALDAEMSAGLADCAVDTLVTGHDAFGYLADRYGLEVVGISGLSPSAEPSPAAQAEITELVRERGVTTVYTETLVDPAVAETVATEAGAQTAVLDPLEGLTDESAGSDYLEVMRANLATLQEGQSCT
ncbi:metal ABC transporter substrate-binding protein [Geodermatophilus sp. DSM 45219]|uniref:metal ABC transporter substrate-binding protein n=1 Tax=Geodermatophilus sp. DSM 45219 TaxID=1881103 RepID=UPI0008841916|nr:metal ABC transporter substrate-binding protein [Geodermatophilus sp. DSM 45219]SDO17657.1 zinc transport system substrate-binding protein [Geodermatophilus sp. DSM 45219]